MTTERSWPDLPPDQKREARFKKWLAPTNIWFKSYEAEEGYRRRVMRFIIDMYRRPQLLLEAMDSLTPIVIEEALKNADAAMSPVVLMPLHKGPAGFMSGKQFETFYWPTFRRVMLALINEGFVPMPFAEGDYGPRLEIIKDMPRGTVIWHFETMDMARAKRVLGDNACIAGNVPIGLLHTGAPREVKEACRKLIETCAPGGGYILAASAAMDEGNADNLRAMMEAAEEYGVYR